MVSGINTIWACFTFAVGKFFGRTLTRPHGHWGGDGNGRLDFPITFFSIVLDSLVRPSEGVVAFDAVTAYYGEEQKIPVEAKFEPTNQWGYFWSKKDIPSGKLKLTCTGSQALTVEVFCPTAQPP